MEEIDKKQYPMACMQLNVILSNLPEIEMKKIPCNILNEIKRYKSNTYVYKYDYSKKLLEQEMLPLTQELLYYIYTKYLKNKDVKRNINVEEKYFNIDEIFNIKRTSRVLNKEAENMLPIVEKRETLFKKVVGFFKRIFKK